MNFSKLNLISQISEVELVVWKSMQPKSNDIFPENKKELWSLTLLNYIDWDEIWGSFALRPEICLLNWTIRWPKEFSTVAICEHTTGCKYRWTRATGCVIQLYYRMFLTHYTLSILWVIRSNIKASSKAFQLREKLNSCVSNNSSWYCGYLLGYLKFQAYQTAWFS